MGINFGPEFMLGPGIGAGVNAIKSLLGGMGVKPTPNGNPMMTQYPDGYGGKTTVNTDWAGFPYRANITEGTKPTAFKQPAPMPASKLPSFSDARDLFNNPPAATPTPQADFLDQLMQQVLNPGGGASSSSIKSSYDLKGALGDVNNVYAPQLSALDKLAQQKKSTEASNENKLKALYASLVSGTLKSGQQGDQHYNELMGKQSASTQAERDAITARYNQQLSDMQKQMTDSGFANLIPIRTQKIQDQMNRELANINTQGDIAQNQSKGLQGSQHNWYGESANVNKGQGVNAIAASMRQLQDILSQIDGQKANVLSERGKAQMSARESSRASLMANRAAAAKASVPDYKMALDIYKLQQDQATAKTEAAAKTAQQKYDNAIKAYLATKGVINGTTGQSSIDPNGLQQIMAGMK